MLLFINVFITNKKRKARVLPDDRLDVFKYQLASLSVIPWDKIVIYCLLDRQYSSRENELRQWIDSLFNCSTEYYPHRSSSQPEWQSAVSKIFGQSSDKLVFFLNNDDHIFTGRDLSIIDEAKQAMQSEKGFTSFYFSHWPENVRWYAGKNAQKIGRLAVTNRDVTDSLQIINEELLKAWWFDLDYGDSLMIRSDNIMEHTEATRPFMNRAYFPLIEIGYHMEGYAHVNYPRHLCPIIQIPPGFFEKEMRIAYCPDQKRPGWINIDPRKQLYDTDYRFLLEEVPLFWKDRIVEQVITDVDEESLIQSRINFIRQICAFAPSSAWSRESDAYPDASWFLDPRK